MKTLQIKDGKGQYSLNGIEFHPIDEISKDDLMTLLNIALDPDQVMLIDEYIPELITHPAHKIIYSNLHDKFSEVLASKSQFVDDMDELYKDAYHKYKVDESE